MKTCMKTPILLCLIAIALNAQDTTVQSWTSSDGKVIQAKFIKLEGEFVTLESGGQQHKFPLARLSPESAAQAKAAAGQVPAPASTAESPKKKKGGQRKKAEAPESTAPALIAEDLDSRVLAVQPDGKKILAGWFSSVLGVPRSHIARIHEDGTLDMGFDPKAGGPAANVQTVALQPDGKILIGGWFTTLQPNGAETQVTRRCIARLNPDGSLDGGFDPHVTKSAMTDFVSDLQVQADGKILVAGNFEALQPNGASAPTKRHHIARLNADGSLDMAFDPNANAAVWKVLPMPGGKILLAGDFNVIRPNNTGTVPVRQGLARLNADGSLDLDFNPNPLGGVLAMAVQKDGKILLGGSFTRLQPGGAAAPTTRGRMARLHADGSLDPTFDPNANDYINHIKLLPEGKILIQGKFTTLQPNGASSPTPCDKIARLNPGGSLDTTFNPKAPN
jgi:trimeric autotransporter adhesin